MLSEEEEDIGTMLRPDGEKEEDLSRVTLRMPVTLWEDQLEDNWEDFLTELCML
jgi:hypothetical protein